MQTMHLEGAVWTLIQHEEHVVQGRFEFGGGEHWLETHNLQALDQTFQAGLHVLSCGGESCGDQVSAAFVVRGDARGHLRQAMQAMLAYLAERR
ncbi:MAG TPA: hypothetical protein VGE07_15545 [Herpetosiphonaceae bacterium]